MKLLKCAIYCAVSGTVGFFFGRLPSQCPMRPDKGLFRCYLFGKNGTLYFVFLGGAVTADEPEELAQLAIRLMENQDKRYAMANALDTAIPVNAALRIYDVMKEASP